MIRKGISLPNIINSTISPIVFLKQNNNWPNNLFRFNANSLNLHKQITIVMFHANAEEFVMHA